MPVAWAIGGGGTGDPNIYDVFVRDGSGNSLINTAVYPNYSAALGSALTSNNLWFHGAKAMAANGGARVRIYAPSTWAGGSSYAHLDYNTFNNTQNQLMVYAISNGESIHDPGPVTKGLLGDLGWGTGGATTTNPPLAFLPILFAEKVVLNQSSSVGYHLWKYYTVNAPSSYSQIKVELYNMSSDVDLYVRKTFYPTSSASIVRPWFVGTTPETCILPNSGSTTWRIGVYGWTAGSYTIKATLQ